MCPSADIDVFLLLFKSRLSIKKMNGGMILMIFALLLASTYQTKQFLVFEIYGNRTTAYYHLDIDIGTPPQRSSVIVDTGSSLLIVQCRNCTDQRCREGLYPNFQPNTNTQYVMCDTKDLQCANMCGPQDSRVPCFYRLFYGQYSVVAKGYYLEDEIQFPSKSVLLNESFSSRFVCASSFGGYNQQFRHIDNGVLGLGPDSRVSTIYGWFQRRGLNLPKIFSLCLADNGGYFQLGLNPQNNLEPISVSTNFTSSNSYTISLQEIAIGSQSLVSSVEMLNYKVILDSGSPYIMLPNQKYLQMLASLNEVCKQQQYNCAIRPQEYFHCYTLDKTNAMTTFEQELDTIFPLFSVTIGDKIIDSKPSTYMNRIRSGKQGAKFCLDIVSRKDDKLLLGAAWMRNQKITFDLDHKKITILPGADCSFQNQPIQCNSQASPISIAISYLSLLAILLFIFAGSPILRKVSRIINRLTRRQSQLVEEELQQRNGPPVQIG